MADQPSAVWKRDYNRMYMRSWRARDPEATRQQSSEQYVRRKAKRPCEARGVRCELCGVRLATMKIVRLVPLPNGEFAEAEIDYCGTC